MRFLAVGIILLVYVIMAYSRPELCKLTSDEGDCRAIITRYYFSVKYGECKTFFYGGCGGNENNFMSLAECKGTCYEYEPQENELYGQGNCALPPKRGECYFMPQRIFYYNQASMQCERFPIGICGSNANSFLSLQGCMQACSISGPRRRSRRQFTKK